ncbi:hypothetical protein G6F46_013232 [Rhizopus delemar]|nr:hypothetical protein G6F46_013232 [Rhizopus delemar]
MKMGVSTTPWFSVMRPRRAPPSVASTEEAVALLDRVLVSLEHAVLAGERGNHHQQGAFRQVEIGHHRVDAADAVARGDEDLGLAGERQQLAIAHRAFQRTHHRGADTNHPAASRARAPHLLHQFGTDIQPLAVHHVVLQVIGTHRLEGARAHVQGDVAEVHALLLQRGQQRFVEMQAGGRRGHRAHFTREHGGRRAAATAPVTRAHGTAARRTRRRGPAPRLRRRHPARCGCRPSATCWHPPAHAPAGRRAGARSGSPRGHRWPSARTGGPESPGCR